MINLMIVLALAASPAAGVALGKRAGLTTEAGQARAEAVRRALGPDYATLPIEDFTACASKRPCVLKEAAARGWSAVVLVETATVLTDALVNVTLLSVGDGREVKRLSLQVPETKLADELARATSPTRDELAKLLRPTSVVTAKVEPKPAAAPPEPTPAPIAEAKAVEGARPAARWIPAIVGGVAFATGVVLVSVSASYAARLERDVFSSPDEPTRLASAGAALQGVGWALAIGGGVVAVGGVLLSFVWPSPRVVPVVSLARDGGLVGVRGVFP